jgi:hypothetical protein
MTKFEVRFLIEVRADTPEQAATMRRLEALSGLQRAADREHPLATG